MINLDETSAVEKLGENPFTIKEGSEYRMRVKFRVQHEVISGLRYLQLVKRKKIPVDKSDQMMVGCPIYLDICRSDANCSTGKLRSQHQGEPVLREDL